MINNENGQHSGENISGQYEWRAEDEKDREIKYQPRYTPWLDKFPVEGNVGRQKQKPEKNRMFAVLKHKPQWIHRIRFFHSVIRNRHAYITISRKWFSYVCGNVLLRLPSYGRFWVWAIAEQYPVCACIDLRYNASSESFCLWLLCILWIRALLFARCALSSPECVLFIDDE